MDLQKQRQLAKCVLSCVREYRCRAMCIEHESLYGLQTGGVFKKLDLMVVSLASPELRIVGATLANRSKEWGLCSLAKW